MKKSFMTRALATGLSLAMAFSLTAATNVTTAAAAAKPAMKASKMTVKEGKSKTFLATAKTLKTYKITKAKVKNASAKQYISVKKNAKGTGIVVTGKKAGTTARKLVITFQNKKTKKTTNLTTKVVVKAVEQKPEEEQLTMTAAVKGVKTIEVSFNKAIASPDAVKVTVKKGTAARDCKATVDGSKITVAMEAKLTAGTYTVSVEGVDTAAMTADVVVEKDETLTSFEISDYLVAKSVTDTTTGSIKYAALNQYGEKMSSTQPTATCSFGSDVTIEKAATATKEGVISVKNINTTLAIVGTKGTVVLVGDKGITASKEISYNVAATATTVELVGSYHKNSASLKNITENDTISDYELLFTVKDQYGYDMDVAELGKLQISLVGGLTGLSAGDAKTLSSRTYNGVDYVALPLTGTGKATAGDATLMIVNPYKGLLLNTTVSVAKSVVIKSISITADNGVYEDQDNEMGYEFVDADGKSVTSYAELTNAVKFDANANYRLRFERKSDGTAKLLLKPVNGVVIKSDSSSNKNSTPMVVIVSANKMTSGDYLMKTFTFTVNQKRVVTGVTGIKSDVVTSMSKGNKKGLTIKSTDLLLADQYSNKVTSDEGIFNKNLFDTTVAKGVSGTAVKVDTNGCVTADIKSDKLVVTPANGEAGTATVYLKYADGNKAVTVSASDYDAKFSISVYDTASVDVSTLAIDSIKDGFAVELYGKDAADPTKVGTAKKDLTVDDIKVVAMVGGTKTVIPSDQYVIVKNENNTLSTTELNAGTDTKTAKLTVQVTTWDSSNTPIETQISKEYQVSCAGSKLYKVTDSKGDVSETLAAAKTVTAAAFVKQFKFVNQYNQDVDVDKDKVDTGSVSYKIENVSATNKSGYTITSNDNNQAKLEIKEAGTYTFKITVTAPNGSTKSFNYNVTYSK